MALLMINSRGFILYATLQVVIEAQSVLFFASLLVYAGARIVIPCLPCRTWLRDHVNSYVHPIEWNLRCASPLGLHDYDTAVLESLVCARKTSTIVRVGRERKSKSVAHVRGPSGKVYQRAVHPCSSNYHCYPSRRLEHLLQYG